MTRRLLLLLLLGLALLDLLPLPLVPKPSCCSSLAPVRAAADAAQGDKKPLATTSSPWAATLFFFFGNQSLPLVAAASFPMRLSMGTTLLAVLSALE